MNTSKTWSRAKKGLTISLLAVAMAAPAPAFAFGSLMSIAASKLAKILQDIEETAAINAATIESTISQMLSKQSSVEAILGAGEKVTAGKKELTQAELNYHAAQQSNDRYFDAQNKYTDRSAIVPGVCELMASTEAARTVNENASTVGKALTRASVRQQMYVDNASVAAREVMDNYRGKYCSDFDVQRGRCTAAVSADMQGASLQAGTLLTPTSGETYTPQEAQAAADFIQMVTNPMPEESLPKGLEKSRSGERFVLAQMHAQAQMSVANSALNHVMASRNPQGTGNKDAISVVGMLKDIAGSTFGNSKHEKEVVGTGEKPMYQLINLHLADANWMDYQTYNQNERIESILAAQLAVIAKNRSDSQMGSARAFVTR